jgi:hypothetical protein
MGNKYPGFDKNDTGWDDFHKKNKMMTNHEFFTSNAKGSFYEGYEWDADLKEWVPNEETRQRQQMIEEMNKCPDCGGQKPNCECY